MTRMPTPEEYARLDRIMELIQPELVSCFERDVMPQFLNALLAMTFSTVNTFWAEEKRQEVFSLVINYFERMKTEKGAHLSAGMTMQ